MRLPKQITEETVVEDTKYIVFKRGEFEQWLNPAWRAHPEPVLDATVIRGQDLFAAPALDSYANAINIALRLMPLDPVRASLEKVADYFFDRAQEARMIGYKLPDGDDE